MAAAEVHDVFQLAGTTLEGRFVVDHVVAEGGFGVVYRAQQVALDRPIALKVLKTPARFDDGAKRQFLASFATEAKTIARIAHPNIVQVFDFGVSEMPSGVRAAWMALEWVTGITLEDELLRRRGRGGRSPSECLTLLKPVLSALALVHAGGVAHRDIKPANIMLVPTPEGAALKLLDFGIAKVMDADEAPGTGQTHTRSDHIAFSPGHAAPEQVSHGRSGPWTDVHAMGLVLSELLTDRRPLDAEDVTLLVQQIMDRTRPTPAKRGVDVGDWEAVLCRALAVSPGERYRDAGELLRALETTVEAASAAHVSIPDDALAAAGLPAGVGNDTLAVMSTQMADPVRAATPPTHVTTSTPISSPELEITRRRRTRAPLYAASGLALAVIAGVAWRVLTLQTAPTTPVASTVSGSPIAVSATPPVATAAVPTPPASATNAPATPSAQPAAAASSLAPPPRRPPPPHAIPSHAPATPAKPVSSGNIVIE